MTLEELSRLVQTGRASESRSAAMLFKDMVASEPRRRSVPYPLVSQLRF